MIDKMQQKIWCIKEDLLFAKGKWQGLQTQNLDYYKDLLEQEGEFLPRGPLEEDPSYKQIVGQIILQVEDKYLIHRMSESNQEVRLHNLWPIFLGGHIEEIDQRVDEDLLQVALDREFDEEVTYDGNILSQEYLGIIYLEDGNLVNHHHIGLVCKLMGDSFDIKSNESGLVELTFVDKDYLQKHKSKLTYWSRLMLDNL